MSTPSSVNRLERPPWLLRKFTFDRPPWQLADILERLHGTVPRLAPLLAGLDEGALHRSIDTTWSIAQNVGHLGDTEELWWTRFEEIRDGRDVLTPADSELLGAAGDGHAGVSIETLIDRFARLRARWTEALESAPEPLQLASAFHGRLGTPMRLVDCAQFAADHDDHHLWRIRQLRREIGMPVR